MTYNIRFRTISENFLATKDMNDRPILGSQKASATGSDTAASQKRLLYWAAAFSFGSLAAHAIDTPDHLREWWGYSTFFVLTGAFQLFFGIVLLIQPWRYDESGGVREDSGGAGKSYFSAGLAVSASVILVYIVSRTTGLPFLGDDAVRQPLTVLSLAPIAEQLPLIYCLGTLLRRSGTAPMEFSGTSDARLQR